MYIARGDTNNVSECNIHVQHGRVVDPGVFNKTIIIIIIVRIL